MTSDDDQKLREQAAEALTRLIEARETREKWSKNLEETRPAFLQSVNEALDSMSEVSGRPNTLDIESLLGDPETVTTP